MYMANRVFRCELGKLLCSKFLIGFLLCCVALNVTVVVVDSRDREEINGLSLRVSQEGLQTTRDIFDHYDAQEIARQVKDNFSLSGDFARMVDEKYRQLQPVVHRLAEENAALDYYAGPYTFDLQERLFSTMFRIVVAQGCLLAVLLLLYLVGYEQVSKTNTLLFTTKKGRSLLATKVLAAGLVSLCCYLVLCAITFSVYFSLWDYSGFWNSSVSSGNNYMPVFATPIPFITWHSFTVGSYFWAVLWTGVLLVLVFLLCSGVLVLVMPNALATFLGLGLLCFLVFFLSSASFVFTYAPGLYFLLDLTPVMLWFYLPFWYTDACGCSLFPYYELVGLGLNLAVLTLLLFLSYKRFCRKDVVL